MATSIKLDEEMKQRVQKLAHLRQRSSHWILREAIAQYVAREEARESFKQEARESWTAFQESGLHLTGPAVRNWLNKWGTDSETEMPDCHS